MFFARVSTLPPQTPSVWGGHLGVVPDPGGLSEAAGRLHDGLPPGGDGGVQRDGAPDPAGQALDVAAAAPWTDGQGHS